MFRPTAALLVAAFAFAAGIAHADPQYNRGTLPTANLWNRSGHTARVEFRENGTIKQSMLTYSGNSTYAISLQGTFVLEGTVDVGGKNVAIVPRTVKLALGNSLNLSLYPNGSGGYYFKDGT